MTNKNQMRLLKAKEQVNCWVTKDHDGHPIVVGASSTELIQRWNHSVLPWDVNIGWLLIILPCHSHDQKLNVTFITQEKLKLMDDQEVWGPKIKCGVCNPRRTQTGWPGGDNPLLKFTASPAGTIQRWNHTVLPWDENIGGMLIIVPCYFHDNEIGNLNLHD